MYFRRLEVHLNMLSLFCLLDIQDENRRLEVPLCDREWLLMGRAVFRHDGHYRIMYCSNNCTTQWIF